MILCTVAMYVNHDVLCWCLSLSFWVWACARSFTTSWDLIVWIPVVLGIIQVLVSRCACIIHNNNNGCILKKSGLHSN